MWRALILIIQFSAAAFVLKIFKFLGIGLVFYIGSDFVIDALISLLETSISGISADVLQILELMGFSTGMTYLATAFVTGATFKLVNKPILGGLGI